ncbi:hypothetical protein V461_07575 [Pantoea ananatis BRT98]|nr:hypothetical protein V461_07575 [Pantoea ananatis BRT98]
MEGEAVKGEDGKGGVFGWRNLFLFSIFLIYINYFLIKLCEYT